LLILLWTRFARAFVAVIRRQVVYPAIVIAQQSGAICGATLATYTAAFGGLPILAILALKTSILTSQPPFA